MKCVPFTVLAVAVLAVLGVDASSGSGSGSASGPIICPSIGCAPENPTDPVCGTDGVTYRNECELSIVCKREKVKVADRGACTTGSGSGKSNPNGTEQSEPMPPSVPSPSPSPAPTTSAANVLSSIGLSAVGTAAALVVFN